jgi:lipopolysaccharide transport system ATP-binding protein
VPPAIETYALSKRYRLGHLGGRANSFREAVTAAPRTLLRGILRRAGKATHEEFWALRDVDLSIEPGEKVGIIGRNGSGKSTLLKILSRIVEPTSGRGVLRGRLASLLEVGTGFHPELSGRENIYLNGAILGMSRGEIRRVFDAIVAFAEVERFLDTPVKWYSSGMYVRLAFAVAAHLEPEILIIDEVLAVGDARFQKKCLGRMDEIGREGRTILFVSHNMAAVQKLCARVIVLRDGRIATDAEPQSAITSYMGDGESGELAYHIRADMLAERRGPIWITAMELRGATGTPAATLATGDPVTLRIDYEASTDVAESALAFRAIFKGALGQEVLRLSTMPISGFPIDHVGRSGTVELAIDTLPFTAGRYFLDVAIQRPNIEVVTDYPDVASIEIQPRDVYQSGFSLTQAQCLIVTPHHWRHRRTDVDTLAVDDPGRTDLPSS